MLAVARAETDAILRTIRALAPHLAPHFHAAPEPMSIAAARAGGGRRAPDKTMVVPLQEALAEVAKLEEDAELLRDDARKAMQRGDKWAADARQMRERWTPPELQDPLNVEYVRRGHRITELDEEVARLVALQQDTAKLVDEWHDKHGDLLGQLSERREALDAQEVELNRLEEENRQLKETGREMGVTIERLAKENGLFRERLETAFDPFEVPR